MKKMMKICGKTPDGVAQAVAVSKKGAINIKRIWETQNNHLVHSYITHDTPVVSDAYDVSEWGFVSLRILNSTIEKIGNDLHIYTKPVRVTFYGDRTTDDGNYVKDMNGNNIEIFAPSGTEITITPEELPVLNYLQNIRVKLAMDVEEFKARNVTITETDASGNSVTSTVSVLEAAKRTTKALQNGTTIVPKVEIKAYINLNVITKR